jgi:hypothetical protein
MRAELVIIGSVFLQHAMQLRFVEQDEGKCCNFESGDGGRCERKWAARSQAARSNSWSMN